MRVVYVSTLSRGGPISHLRGLLPHVAATGVDVHLVCASEAVARPFRDLGIETSVLPLRHKLDLAGAWRLSPLLDGDVVHTHDRRAGLLARPQARLSGARAVHTIHGLPEAIAVSVGRPKVVQPPGVSRTQLAWFLHGYLRVESLLARFGAVVAPSRALARFLTQHSVPESRIRVIPSGIDVRRCESPTGGDRATVAAAAMLEYWKGIDVLLTACARLPQRVRIDIYGDGTERRALEKQAATLGLDAHFHGFVDDLRERLEAVDVFVLPSRGENFPIAVLEAMAAAIPVAATRVGGVPELVVDGQTGLLCEPDDADGLSEVIARLVADSELRRRLGENAARRVSSEFDPAATADRVIAVYDELFAPG